MHQIFVFPSSKIYDDVKNKIFCKERAKIVQLIGKMNSTHSIPIDKKLVENDALDGRKFRKKELRLIKESHIFIAVLKENYSDNVAYEIKTAFKFISDENLILILRKHAAPSEIEPEQQKFIDSIKKKKDVITYKTLEEFERLVGNTLFKMVGHLYKQKRIPLPFQF